MGPTPMPPSPTRATTPATCTARLPEHGSEIVTPPKRDRKARRSCDTELYKERNLIERFFNKLKRFRRGATRYDKLLDNFVGFVKLAAIAIWRK